DSPANPRGPPRPRGDPPVAHPRPRSGGGRAGASSPLDLIRQWRIHGGPRPRVAEPPKRARPPVHGPPGWRRRPRPARHRPRADGGGGPGPARELKRPAEQDSRPAVRGQLACTARRLPAADALPVIRALICRDMDANDPHIPLLLWWAVERHALAARTDVTAM